MDAVRANRARVNASLTTAGLRLISPNILSTSSVEDGQKGALSSATPASLGARVAWDATGECARSVKARGSLADATAAKAATRVWLCPRAVPGHVTRHSRSDLTLKS